MLERYFFNDQPIKDNPQQRVDNIAAPDPEICKGLANIPVTHRSNKGFGFGWEGGIFLFKDKKMNAAKKVFTNFIEPSYIISIP